MDAMLPGRALLAFAGLSLTGCSATDLANALTPAGDVTREAGLPYRPAGREPRR